ncbi:MAG: hypothetical protein RL701_2486, partial [Pseudomonadota bacterium]
MYDGPGIYAYGHFFGFFPGTLYDENVGFTPSFLWLRVATAIWLVGLSLLIVSCWDSEAGKLRVTPRPGHMIPQSLALLCSALACIAEFNSDELGWTTSSERVRSALGAHLTSQRCELYFPREWPKRDRQRLGEDCDFRVLQAEQWLQVAHPARIGVYYFRSPAEKYALMGAEGTNLAKPWRSEVYISNLGWPNPVLGHELVHVVARAAGSGPFRIAGRAGGLWPNPALIEGVAMAAAFQPSGGLTLHEWGRAMLELNMMPPLAQLFGPNFFGQQERLAYTLSGSLLRFVHERWGAAAVRATYSSGDLARGVGVPIAQIEAAWREYLRAQPLTPNALDLARARFSGGGVLSALCPHVLAKLRDGLRTDVAAGDDDAARTTCQNILKIDARDAGTRATLASVLARLGDETAARAELTRLQNEHAPAPYTAAVRQTLADAALRRGQYDQALALYETLLSEPLDDDQKRTLQVKALASRGVREHDVTQDAQLQKKFLYELLVGSDGLRADPATAVYLTRALSEVRADGLGRYLEGRQLFFQARFEYAADRFAEAAAKGLPTAEIALENLRCEAISRLASSEPGQRGRAAQLFREYAAAGSAAQRAEAADYLARIAYLDPA